MVEVRIGRSVIVRVYTYWYCMYCTCSVLVCTRIVMYNTVYCTGTIPAVRASHDVNYNTISNNNN